MSSSLIKDMADVLAVCRQLVIAFLLVSCVQSTSGTLSEMFFFQMSCNDDMSVVRSLSTDCSKYMVCTGGHALAFSCPMGYIFNDFSMRCQLPSEYEKRRCSRLLLDNMPLTCLQYPNAKIPSYLSCAQYFDCTGQRSYSGGPPSYVTECPYPKLFSPETGQCRMFHKVRCIGRREPKAPCDYLQYPQLCESANCPPCESRHPSCVGKYDGAYPVANSTTLYIVCLAERTINIGRCTDGFRYSVKSKTCVPKAQKTNPHPNLAVFNQLSAILSKIKSFSDDNGKRRDGGQNGSRK